MPTTPLRSQYWLMVTIIGLFALTLPAVSCAAQDGVTDPAPPNAEMAATVMQIRSSMRKFGVADAPEKAEGAVRLTTYNIENLFDDVDDPTLSGRNEDIDDTKPEHELIAVAQAIRAVNPDILCVEEVESESALRWFVDAYLADMGYEHIVSIDAGNDRGIENAVLSRHEIVHAENWPNKPLGGVHPEKYGNQKNWYAGEPIAFRRSPLRVDIKLPEHEEPVTLFVVHHKSGRYNEYWRVAEAKGTVKIIEQIQSDHPDRPIVVLGDFNATPEQDPVQAYLESGFVDIFGDRAQSNKIITHESARRIDLILANPAAEAMMDIDNAFVYGTASRPDGVDWRDLPTFNGYASDHFPVSVDLGL